MRWLFLFLMATLAPGSASAADAPLEAALRDMCDSQVAMLGEPAGHGDARTIEAKTELVRRLIDECGFGAVFFEGSTYDFLELERRRERGEPVDRAMVSSSIGGLWNRYKETQPLIDFLFERSVAGRVRLGGIDDQLGSAGAFYSISAMPTELVGLLPEEDRAGCREEMRRLIYGQVGPTVADRTPVQICISVAGLAVAVRADEAGAAERMYLLDNMSRYAWRRPEVAAGTHVPSRDRSMWLNFLWLRDRLPRGTKIILWGATTHFAPDATAYPLFAVSGNFGHFASADYGRGAFVLGFTAESGSYRTGGQARDMAPALPGSIEAEALRGSVADAVYLDVAALRRMGRRPGGVFEHAPLAVDWSTMVDGVIVFREERAPEMLPR